MVDILIFDMDGVLVDESLSCRAAIVKTAEFFLKKQVDIQRIKHLKQKGGYNNDCDCLETLLAEYGILVDPQEIERRFDAYYQELKVNERWLLEEPILVRLKKRFRLAIFTGRSRKDALDALRRFEKETFFEIVVTDDEVKKRKPDPEGLFLILKQLKAEKALFFGDSRDDARAARAASLNFVGVVAPGETKGNLAQIGIEMILENVNEIETIFGIS